MHTCCGNIKLSSDDLLNWFWQNLFTPEQKSYYFWNTPRIRGLFKKFTESFSEIFITCPISIFFGLWLDKSISSWIAKKSLVSYNNWLRTRHQRNITFVQHGPTSLYWYAAGLKDGNYTIFWANSVLLKFSIVDHLLYRHIIEFLSMKMLFEIDQIGHFVAISITRVSQNQLRVG